MPNKNIYAIVWECWDIGGWCFPDIESAVREAKKHCKVQFVLHSEGPRAQSADSAQVIRCKTIKIAKRVGEADFEIVHSEEFDPDKDAA
jgi:hypothetical protein